MSNEKEDKVMEKFLKNCQKLTDQIKTLKTFLTLFFVDFSVGHLFTAAFKKSLLK